MGVRLLDHMAEAAAQLRCPLHGLQAFGMQLGTAMVLQHESDPELARRTGAGVEEGALGHRPSGGVEEGKAALRAPIRSRPNVSYLSPGP
jgi:hypothetical protein